MVERDDGVEFAAGGAHEDRVGRKRARDVDAFRPGGRDGRNDDRFLFGAEQPALAGMRIEARDRQPRRGDAESRQGLCGEPDRAEQPLARERAWDLGQRDVDGREHDAQPVGPEHHRRFRHAAEMRQQIGVAAPGKSRGGEGGLVDRRRDDRLHAASACVLGRANDRVVRRPRRHRAHLPCRKRREFLGQMRSVNHRPAHVHDARMPRRLDGDLGSNPRRVTRGYGNQGQRHQSILDGVSESVALEVRE